ncbi:sensor histidine kinase [Defluviitalea saccharophila]|uniref:Sensor histidine kinase n=1 Tax=Defluviitalea saccharophila TaxID=879970 RepID=A0ABZ2Y1K7_9FIRM
MGSSYSFFKKKGIRVQLLTYFISLIVLAVVVLSGVGSMLYSQAIQSESNLYTEQMISQIKTNIDSRIQEMENIIYFLSQDSRAIEFFAVHYGAGEEDLALRKDVKSILGRFEKIYPEIAGILIVNKNDLEISNNIQRIARDPLVSEKWYKKAVENPDTMHLFSKPIGRNIQGTKNYSADDVVCVVKAVKDAKTDEIMGVILIDLKLDIITQIIEQVQLGKKGFVFIMDEEGGIVYTPVNPITYRIKPEWLLDEKVIRIEKRIRGSSYQILSHYSDYTTWKTIGVFSLAENQQVISQINLYSFIIVILFIVLGILCATYFSASIAGPISKLKELMKKAEEGDLDVRFSNVNNNEIDELGFSFNHMIEKIKNLINLVYIEQKMKREAELKILEAQIKPHFLYNTLDTIQWMAQEHDAQDIVQMVNALTNLFRIGLNKGKELVTVKEELKHIESYLIIQMVRYEDKLKYEIEVEDDILNYNVLKIILQPIVENAIYHGIKARRGMGTIKITGKQIDKKLCFCVEDDGVGMLPEKVLEINEILQGKQSNENPCGYGMFNINERIKLAYGAEYGLVVNSTYGEGTRVEVWHPIIEA